jgi:hypothetical protein
MNLLQIINPGHANIACRANAARLRTEKCRRDRRCPYVEKRIWQKRPRADASAVLSPIELAVNFVQLSLAIAINAEKHLAIMLRQRRLKLVTFKLFKNP